MIDFKQLSVLTGKNQENCINIMLRHTIVHTVLHRKGARILTLAKG
jgi:hypothetical protein